MLADAVINLGRLVAKPLIQHGPAWAKKRERAFQSCGDVERPLSTQGIQWLCGTSNFLPPKLPFQSTLAHNSPTRKPNPAYSADPPDDAPPHHLVSTGTVLILLPLTSASSALSASIYTFGAYIPISLNLLAIVLALLLSIMSGRHFCWRNGPQPRLPGYRNSRNSSLPSSYPRGSTPTTPLSSTARRRGV